MKKLYIMKRVYLVVAILAIFIISCQTDSPLLNKLVENKDLLLYTTGNLVTIDEAMSNLDLFMQDLYGESRSGKHRKYSVDNVIAYSIPKSTRSVVNVDLPDTLVYIVPFEDASGYAILGAQRNMSPIYSVVEKGVFNFEKFSNAIDSEINNNIISRSEYLERMIQEECVECLEYAVDSESFTYGMTANAIIGDAIKDPVILNPSPDIPEITPGGPVVVARESKVGYEFVEYVAPMVKTAWHQYSPLNTYCKDKDGAICPVGCVVIAVAQILAYHEYPRNKAFNNVVVDWSLVKALDVYDYDENKVDSESAIAANQLANLCFELGKKEYCNVKYATDGTPTTIYKAKDALSKLEYKNLDIRLGFAKGDREVAYNQLREGELVFMKAATSNSAHAWVVDGFVVRKPKIVETTYYSDGTKTSKTTYDSNQELIHINWGWNGYYDGYYISQADIDVNDVYEQITNSLPMEGGESPFHYIVSFKILTYDL